MNYRLVIPLVKITTIISQKTLIILKYYNINMVKTCVRKNNMCAENDAFEKRD
jgi:hypothetical protein